MVKGPSRFQASLFDDLPLTEPAGLVYQSEFLSPAQESELLAVIRTLPLKEMQYKQYTARRRIVSYGKRYDFDTHHLDTGPDLIDALLPLRNRVAGWLGVRPTAFEQVLVAEYSPGTPLGWHRDVPDFEDIVGVSLLAPATMRFRPYPPASLPSKTRELVVEPRSIYLLRGASRWEWQHSVAPVDALRYSITFRTPRTRAHRRAPCYPWPAATHRPLRR